jgi:hypothetical protein
MLTQSEIFPAWRGRFYIRKMTQIDLPEKGVGTDRTSRRHSVYFVTPLRMTQAAYPTFATPSNSTTVSVPSSGVFLPKGLKGTNQDPPTYQIPTGPRRGRKTIAQAGVPADRCSSVGWETGVRRGERRPGSTSRKSPPSRRAGGNNPSSPHKLRRTQIRVFFKNATNLARPNSPARLHPLSPGPSDTRPQTLVN